MDEINHAASLMIIEGRGNGMFDPDSDVTRQEAVTMFMRAIGEMVNYDIAIAMGAACGLIDAETPNATAMTRIATAELIVNALRYLGMEPTMTLEDAVAILEEFTDLGDLTDEEMIVMAICVELGIFRGAGEGLMNPNDVLQRSQMASLAVRLQDVILGIE